MVNEFNIYFCKVGCNLSKLLPATNVDFKSYFKNPISNSLVCDKASPNELYNMMSYMNNSKISSCNNFSNSLWVEMKSCILYCMYLISHLNMVYFRIN